MKLKLGAILVIVAFLIQACTSTYDLSTTPEENHPWLQKQYQTYQDFLADATPLISTVDCLPVSPELSIYWSGSGFH